MKKKKVLIWIIAIILVIAVGLTVFLLTRPQQAAQGKIASTMFGGGTPLTMDPALNSASVSGNYIRNAFVARWVILDARQAGFSPEMARS